MTEDEMVGWHHRLNGHGFEQVLGDGEGQGSLACHSPTEQLINNNNLPPNRFQIVNCEQKLQAQKTLGSFHRPYLIPSTGPHHLAQMNASALGLSFLPMPYSY